MQTTAVSTRLRWAAELDGVSGQLEQFGAIRETEDGFAYVDEAIAPEGLVSLYRGLCQVGYVNGWLS